MTSPHLVIPTKLTPNTPILVTLPGMGARWSDLRALTEPFSQETIQLHLEGDLPVGNGFAFFEPTRDLSLETKRLTDIASQLHATVDQIIQKHGWENQPLWSIGFSQGAMLTTVLSALYPNWLSGGAIFSGRLPVFLTQLEPQPLTASYFISQGLYDPLFAPQQGLAVKQFFLQRQASVTYHDYPMGHEINPDAFKDYLTWLTPKLHN